MPDSIKGCAILDANDIKDLHLAEAALEIQQFPDLKIADALKEVYVGLDTSDTLTFELDHAKGTPRSELLKLILPLNVWVLSKGSNSGRKQYTLTRVKGDTKVIPKPIWKEGYTDISADVKPAEDEKPPEDIKP
jgi:hypothetical protein